MLQGYKFWVTRSSVSRKSWKMCWSCSRVWPPHLGSEQQVLEAEMMFLGAALLLMDGEGNSALHFI